MCVCVWHCVHAEWCAWARDTVNNKKIQIHTMKKVYMLGVCSNVVVCPYTIVYIMYYSVFFFHHYFTSVTPTLNMYHYTFYIVCINIHIYFFSFRVFFFFFSPFKHKKRLLINSKRLPTWIHSQAVKPTHKTHIGTGHFCFFTSFFSFSFCVDFCFTVVFFRLKIPYHTHTPHTIDC